MENVKRLVGKKIRQRREEMGFKTQRALAEAFEPAISVSRVTHWEVGDNYPDAPFRETLKSLLKVDDAFFDIQPWLLDLPNSENLKNLIDVFVRADDMKRGLILGYANGLVGPNNPEPPPLRKTKGS